MANVTRRWGVAVAAVAVTVAGVVTAPAAPAASAGRPAAPAAPAVKAPAWQPCGDEFPGIQCATVSVPLDHDRPRGTTTTIALARVPATDRAHRIGSVFVNPGGPGGSGVEMVLGGFGEFLAGQLDGRFDVVGFDPRGVGGSSPLHCFDTYDEQQAFLGSTPVFPYLRAQERPYFDTVRSLGSCVDRAPIGRHMSTADVARDLDLLRRAVGDRKLSYLGFSYGSYLGNTYANLFPGNVRALVIDGVLDPRLWSSGWQIRSDRVATQQEFEEFLRLCDEAGDGCAFATPEGSAARWEALAERLEAEPLTLDDGSVYSYDFLISDAAGAMYGPEGWPLAADFFDALADAALGEAAPASAAQRAAFLDRLRPAGKVQEDYPNGYDAYYGNQCADTQYPSSFGGFGAIARYAEAGSQFGPLWWWFNAPCANWPVAADRYTGPWTARTSAPVLVVGNYFDGVTDYAGAQASARLLRNSRLLSYAGWGHTAYGRSGCVTEYVDAYLLSGALPARDTVCPANPNPFLASASRTAATDAPRVGLPPAWFFR